MQIDFHYYIAYAIAKEAGYDEELCNIIAYASQYTDDNTDRSYAVKYREFEFQIPFPDKIEDKGKRFHPIITQAVSLEAKEIETQRYVYAPFHFLPVGNEEEENRYTVKEGRNKERKNIYCTVAGSENAEALMTEAVNSEDPYRIGIAMHTFADTFSHERFTAFEENWNKVKIKRLTIKRLIPPIGHAQIIHEPDIISNEWDDKRFPETMHIERDNRVRTMDAIEAIYNLLAPSGSWAKVAPKFQKMVDAEDAESRMRFIQDKYKCAEYKKDKWFNEALDITVDISEVPTHPDPLVMWKPKEPRFCEFKFSDDFDNSHWCKFQIAAKEQLAWVLQKMPFL